MTDFAISLLNENADRFKEDNFYKEQNYGQICSELTNAFFNDGRYFAKNCELLLKKPSAGNEELIAFFAPNSSFGKQIIENQTLESPMFSSILTDHQIFSHSIYQGSVENSEFGKFIGELVNTAVESRFSVKFDSFELSNYRNCAFLILEQWAKADLLKLNVSKLAALITGSGSAKICLLLQNEYVSVKILEKLFNDLPDNKFQCCKCSNEEIEVPFVPEECEGFTSGIFCSNNCAALEIALRALTDEYDGGKYYLMQAAFYLLIQMSKFKHINKLPTFLQMIKNMNYAMKHESCKCVFALFYEQITCFLESYLHRLKKSYSFEKNLKDNFYYNIQSMLFVSLDQILIFCTKWQEIYQFDYFQKSFAQKKLILQNLLPFKEIIDGSSLADIYDFLSNSLPPQITHEDIEQEVIKVQYRCQELFDYKVTQLQRVDLYEPYQLYSTTPSLKAAYITAIFNTFKAGDKASQKNEGVSRTINFFDVARIDYQLVNKVTGTKTPEMQAALQREEEEYQRKLLQSGIVEPRSLRWRLRQSRFGASESWQVIYDALTSQLFWVLVVIAGVSIALVKKVTLWLIA